jgi:transcriptional regulator of met regulon
VVLFSLGWTAVWHSFNYGGHFSWVIPGSLFFLSFAFWGSIILAEQSRKRAVFLFGIANLLYLIIFLRFSWWHIIIFSGAILLVALGVNKVQRERKNRIKVHPTKLLHYGFRFWALALSLMIAGGALFFFQEDHFQVIPLLKFSIPKQAVAAALKVVEYGTEQKTTQQAIELTLRGATVDEVLEEQIDAAFSSQEANLLVPIQPKDIPAGDSFLSREIKHNPAVQEILIKRAREDLSLRLGIPIKGDEEMLNALRRSIDLRLVQFISKNKANVQNFSPVGIALGLFITVQSLSWFLRWPFFWTSAWFFNILIKLGAAEIKKERVEVERVGWRI